MNLGWKKTNFVCFFVVLLCPGYIDFNYSQSNNVNMYIFNGFNGFNFQRSMVLMVHTYDVTNGYFNDFLCVHFNLPITYITPHCKPMIKLHHVNRNNNGNNTQQKQQRTNKQTTQRKKRQ